MKMHEIIKKWDFALKTLDGNAKEGCKIVKNLKGLGYCMKTRMKKPQKNNIEKSDTFGI